MWKNTIAFANAKDIWKILFHPSRFLKKITTTAIESVTLSVDVNFYWKIWKSEFSHFLKLSTFTWIFLKKGHICGIFVEKLRFFPSKKIYSSKKQEFVRSFSFIKRADADSLILWLKIEPRGWLWSEHLLVNGFIKATYPCASTKRLLSCISVNCFATRA